ncbi:MAG TPA: hypothetical protein VKL19_06800 [Thermoanaerobaculia bacterium]|nr:hypothetical protein [Thermoanaerobaculia bacterium]
MKRHLWLLLLLASIGSASGTYTTGTAFPTIVVDNNAGDQSVPRVSGNYASYDIATVGGANLIGYYSFSPSGNGTVPSAANFIDSLSDVNGSNIVFTRFNTITGASSIFKYVIGGASSEVAPVAAPAIPLRSNPSIGSNTIAWEDMAVSADNSTEIVLTTDGITTTRVTNDALADQNPNVSPSGDMVVWEKCTVSTCDVYAARLATGWTATPVAATSANETWPDTNGVQIVFASNAGGVQHVYVTTLGGVATQIPSPTTTQDRPAIANNFVAYEGGTVSSHDIYVYDLATGITRQITDTPADNELLSDIAVSGTTVRVVWQVGGDVYATEFSIGSPDQLISDLIDTIESFNLQQGIANSLEAKLTAAQASLAAGDTTAACNEIGAFINEVEAQSDKKLKVPEANQLKTLAQQLQQSLGCP